MTSQEDFGFSILDFGLKTGKDAAGQDMPPQGPYVGPYAANVKAPGYTDPAITGWGILHQALTTPSDTPNAVNKPLTIFASLTHAPVFGGSDANVWIVDVWYTIADFVT